MLTETVTLRPVSLSLSSSLNPSVVGATVTLTGVVADASQTPVSFRAMITGSRRNGILRALYKGCGIRRNCKARVWSLGHWRNLFTTCERKRGPECCINLYGHGHDFAAHFGASPPVYHAFTVVMGCNCRRICNSGPTTPHKNRGGVFPLSAALRLRRR